MTRCARCTATRLRAGPVRLGAFATAAAGLVPKALASLPREPKVTLREGTTPALTRALRAGTLDLAILAQTPPFRPPDTESPALELTTLSERELLIGVREPPVRERRSGRRPATQRPSLGCQPIGRWRLPARCVARPDQSDRTSATSRVTGSPSSTSWPPGSLSRRSHRSSSTCCLTESGSSQSAVSHARRAG